MDRDVASAFPLTPADAVPPYSPSSVRKAGFSGVAMIGVAAALGLVATGMGESASSILSPIRLFLVFTGAIVAGAALSMRPDLWWSWGLGFAASVLAVAGLPDTWDSFQLLFRAIAGVAAAGTLFCLLPSGWRHVGCTVLLLYHFSGIFFATTAPPTSPWLTDQMFRRIYNPYLQFVYLRNAYHFYSPEPGPASVMVFFLKTETGVDPGTETKQYQTQWIPLPTRPANVRDPMGLEYYRMLSLNEQLARGSHSLVMGADDFEKTEMKMRRTVRSKVIPFHPVEPIVLQYKLPNPEVVRYLLPSYASHIILENTPDKETAAKTTVKVYRLEHRDLLPSQLAKGQNPYHPGTYRPFFLGEFDVYGNLVNPQEELLYWMIPIIPRVPAPNDPDDPYKKDYLDYLSVHALELTSVAEVLKANENAGRVFKWSQLR